MMVAAGFPPQQLIVLFIRSGLLLFFVLWLTRLLIQSQTKMMEIYFLIALNYIPKV